MGSLTDAWADLVLGSRCAGCERPGRVLCASCTAALPTDAAVAWPSPTPAGLVLPVAAAAYDGPARALVVGLKERRLLGLAGPLGDLLASAVRAHVATEPQVPWVLVPVPSRPSSVRQRALDSTYVITRGAARTLRKEHADVTAVRLLRTRPGLADQAGLDAAARAANLAGSLTCPSPALARLARHRQQARVLVCDDVLTTGATAREAQRALEAVGLEVAGIATAAAVVRRLPPRSTPGAGVPGA